MFDSCSADVPMVGILSVLMPVQGENSYSESILDSCYAVCVKNHKLDLVSSYDMAYIVIERKLVAPCIYA